jgi:nitrite reductase/ring-hydroxylating ferredoxin subunit
VPGESALIKLCDVSDVEADPLVRADIGGQSYAVFEAERQYYVTRANCVKTCFQNFLRERYLLHLGRDD